NGQPIEFIGNNLFKFLGRKIKFNLSESEQINEIQQNFDRDMKKVDQEPINGFMKLWLYQNYVIAFLSWPFMVYDLNLSLAKHLEAKANKYLKKWTGIPRSANTSILYRDRCNKGKQLTSISLHYKKMQVLKAHTAKHSKDSDIRAVYDRIRSSDAEKIRVWK